MGGGLRPGLCNDLFSKAAIYCTPNINYIINDRYAKIKSLSDKVSEDGVDFSKLRMIF